ncbi:Aste57867_24765 [Aphanomyces stellatus]|uniref:Aste57867_24765 protein n=1 Tax=Aphanomyces stellatus TaxID=120398 RepID=A0A485LRA5_9STRA|nr:hypothetical protein As57867_024687 [Aphanomyces stellatus]VFU01401.1 Aste57867_24765 [Aphanomyces stellatus]
MPLVQAVGLGDVAAVETLVHESLEPIADLAQTLNGVCVVCAALQRLQCSGENPASHEEIVRLVLASDSAAINRVCKTGVTPLMTAIECCAPLEIIQQLCQRCDIGTMHQDMDGKTALHVAASMGWADVVEIVLDGISILDERGATALMALFDPSDSSVSNNIQRDRVRVLHLFLDHDEVDVNMEDGEGGTVRTRLQDDGVSVDIEALATALCAHPSLDVYRVHPVTGHTMLLWAIHKRLPAVIDALLRRADVSDLGQHHQTCHASFVDLMAFSSVESVADHCTWRPPQVVPTWSSILVQVQGVDVNSRNQDGRTALMMLAAMRDDDDDEGLHSLTRFLLDSKSIDANATDNNNLSALLLLQDRRCTAWTIEMATLLCQRPDLDVNRIHPNVHARVRFEIQVYISRRGWMCSGGPSATIRSRSSVRALVVRSDVNITRCGTKAWLLLFQTASVDIVRQYFARPDVDATVHDKTTVLHVASIGLRVDLLEFALNYVDVNATNVHGLTALALVVKQSTDDDAQLRCVHLLLETPGIDVNVVDNDGKTTLLWLVQASIHTVHKSEIARLLCARPELDVNVTHPTSKLTVGAWALREQQQVIVDVLLDRADVVDFSCDGDHRRGITPLMRAAAFASVDVVRRMYRSDVGLEVSLHGETALHVAARAGQVETLAFLLHCDGADVNGRNHRLETPLLLSVTGCGDVLGTVAALLAVPGVDVNAADRDDRTVLCRVQEADLHMDVKAEIACWICSRPELDATHQLPTTRRTVYEWAVHNNLESVVAILLSRSDALEDSSCKPRLNELDVLETLTREPTHALKYGQVHDTSNVAMEHGEFHDEEPVEFMGVEYLDKAIQSGQVNLVRNQLSLATPGDIRDGNLTRKRCILCMVLSMWNPSDSGCWDEAENSHSEDACLAIAQLLINCNAVDINVTCRGISNIVTTTMNIDDPQALSCPTNEPFNGSTPLMTAILCNVPDIIVVQLCQHPNIQLDQTDSDGNTNLHYACAAARPAVVECLLSLVEADAVNCRNRARATPLMTFLITRRHATSTAESSDLIHRGVRTVQLLLQVPCIDLLSTEKYDVLSCLQRRDAPKDETTQVALLLCQHLDGDLTYRDTLWDEKLFHWALKHAYKAIVDSVLARVNMTTTRRQKFNLEWAVYHGDSYAVEESLGLVLAQDFAAEPTDHATCVLRLALEKCNKDNDGLILSMLLNWDSDGAFHGVYKDGSTLLMIAASNTNVDTVDRILGRPTTYIMATAKNGQTALHIAAGRDSQSMLSKFLQCDGVDLNCIDNEGETPLHVATRRGKKAPFMRLLVCDNIDRGETALGIAKAAASIDACGSLNPTAVSMVKSLCRRPELKVDMALVVWAVKHDIIKVVAELFARSDVDVPAIQAPISNPSKTKLFMHAVQFAPIEAVCILSQRRGFNVNQTNKNGDTALHLAAAQYRLDVIQVLLACDGIDVHLMNVVTRDKALTKCTGGVCSTARQCLWL